MRAYRFGGLTVLAAGVVALAFGSAAAQPPGKAGPAAEADPEAGRGPEEGGGGAEGGRGEEGGRRQEGRGTGEAHEVAEDSREAADGSGDEGRRRTGPADRLGHRLQNSRPRRSPRRRPAPTPSSSAGPTSTSPASSRPPRRPSAFLDEQATRQAGEADRRAARAPELRPAPGRHLDGPARPADSRQPAGRLRPAPQVAGREVQREHAVGPSSCPTSSPRPGTSRRTRPSTFFLSNNTVDKMTDQVGKLFLGVPAPVRPVPQPPVHDWKQTEYWGMARSS